MTKQSSSTPLKCHSLNSHLCRFDGKEAELVLLYFIKDKKRRGEWIDSQI
jgi:hypothetical protein